jgi:hypothetical protein
MKKLLGLSLVLACLTAASASAQVSVYTAFLTGANETPNPADPNGVGFVVMAFDASAGTISFNAYVQDVLFPATGSHIHRGAAGVQGPVIIPFNQVFANGVSAGTLTGIAPSFFAEILANPPGYYFNYHNADFPGGAIRGQLRPAPGTFAPTVLFDPVVAKVTGARGESYIGDLRLNNRSSASANVVIDFFASSSTALTGPTATQTVTVSASSQMVINDVLGTVFSTSGVGALRITADKDVIASWRVLNDKRSSGAGTLGFAMPALRIEDACRFGTLLLLSNASASDIQNGVGFRTNVGFFNPNAFSVTGVFTARRNDGTSLGSRTISIPAFSHSQFPVFDLINTVADADKAQTDFYVTYSVSLGPLHVYAAVADDKSGNAYAETGTCSPLP